MNSIDKRVNFKLVVIDENDRPKLIEITLELLEKQAGGRSVKVYNLLLEIDRPYHEAYDKRHPRTYIFQAA
ncbi:MAG: hypothetical protein AABY22_24175 [Nanoarchaeota archaeon]